jgi:hypothetical protein
MTEDQFREALLESLADIADSLRILVDAIDNATRKPE